MEETILVDSREALWKERLADYEASGLSIKKWCSQNEISISTFAYWRKKFKSSSYSKTSDNEMVFAKLPSKEEIRSKCVSLARYPRRVKTGNFKRNKLAL